MEANGNGAVFFEEQKFRQKWLVALLSFISVLLLFILVYSLYQQLYLKKPFGNKPMPDGGLIAVSCLLFVFLFGIDWLFIKMKLMVSIKDNHLNIKFYPFLKQDINIREIEVFNPVTYNPIREYGGWGIRYSLKKRMTAYNVSGNKGVEIQLKNGKRLLVGTQKPEEFIAAIKSNSLNLH